ncbi:MAG: BLF1 family deaminating toxin [Symploca sp. SIO2B6]|nr:BLF1 family deaminating toxin [Symploca sp. SIO2B6]
MPNSTIQDQIRTAMTTGGKLQLNFDQILNTKPSGKLDVYLHKINSSDTVEVDLNPSGGEAAQVLWLPYKQGELTTLQPFSIGNVPSNTLFMTYDLSGCKVFAVNKTTGDEACGPVWHIDAEITTKEFWPQITSDEWVEDWWQPGTQQQVAYLHRFGQSSNLWDLSPYLEGPPPTTYGDEKVLSAVVGGVVNNSKKIDLYFQEPKSSWTSLNYTSQKRKS